MKSIKVYLKDRQCLKPRAALIAPTPSRIQGCPVSINIPSFIKNIERGEILTAAKILKHTSALPAVCGRVCPQEKQCESRCIYNKMKKQPVAIGYLERFAADFERENIKANNIELRPSATEKTEWTLRLSVPDLPAFHSQAT